MAITNSSNYQLAALGKAGSVNVDSSNPFYSAALEGAQLSAITATGDLIDYTFANTAIDLASIIPGAYLHAHGFGNPTNNGIKKITAVNNTTKVITVDNQGVSGVTNASPRTTPLAGVSVQGLKSIAIEVITGLTISTFAERDASGATLLASGDTLAVGTYEYDITELTVSAGKAKIYLNTDRVVPNRQ